MSSIAERKFREELASLLQKVVLVHTSDGKNYTGVLSGIDTETMSMCLTNAKDDSENTMDKLFINGNRVFQVYTVEKGFDLRSLAERLERVFPRMVKLIEEAGVIVVMDKIRVTEKGIIEGRGPAAERVQKIYEEFVKEQSS
ncbi:MAG: Lsm family RNA-binding protein [Candidatus Bathyarchaeota archaeon]|nr:Lsm family RNA-binding protein [Candidatus Bathyarchaeota archaeon]MCZ2845507.1 Lsm family RNA-binding protein [Candidatus Bathyarchaeota archaeon]